MLRASILFLIAGLAALLFGMNGVAGISFNLGRILLFILLGFSILTFLVSLWENRKRLS